VDRSTTTALVTGSRAGFFPDAAPSVGLARLAAGTSPRFPGQRAAALSAAARTEASKTGADLIRIVLSAAASTEASKTGADLIRIVLSAAARTEASKTGATSPALSAAGRAKMGASCLLACVGCTSAGLGAVDAARAGAGPPSFGRHRPKSGARRGGRRDSRGAGAGAGAGGRRAHRGSS
jgi:hypothetical protein